MPFRLADLNRRKGTSIVGTYVTMTTWQRKRFEKFRSWGWPLSILPFFLFFFMLTLRQPTMGFAFSLVRQVSVWDLGRGSKIREPMLSVSSKVLTISNNLTDFKGSSLRRWFAARNYKSAASQLFFQFSIRCLFYSWKGAHHRAFLADLWTLRSLTDFFRFSVF